ncbi:MAG: phage integrase SAM-like domain-containing protein, partial [Planctomycetales bacterium]|nr:phage integrase SAM-like domain-containing protein [Planctomycetales bacterium]
MASLIPNKKGTHPRRIEFQCPAHAGKRHVIRIGTMGWKSADEIRNKIERLVAHNQAQTAPERDLVEWAASISDKFAGDLAKHGLVQPRETAQTATLAEFLPAYVKSRRDIKPATRIVWGHVVRNLLKHFGHKRTMASITPGDADGFKQFLYAEGLTRATIGKRLQFARMFFRAAERHGLVAANPFAGVRESGATRREKRHISLADTQRLLDAADPDLRVVIALGRLAALRIPSEALSLRWEDV